MNSLWAKNIYFLRMATGWLDSNASYSQKEFADLLGISNRTVINWESGHLPTAPKLDWLSTFFSNKFGVEITADDLIHFDLRDRIQIRPVPKEFADMPPEKRAKLSKLEGLFFRDGRRLTEAQIDLILSMLDEFLEKEK